MRKILFILLILFTFYSCKETVLKPSELIAWVENPEHGLNQAQTFEEFKFEAIYKPLDYVVAMEGKTDNLSTVEYETYNKELSGLQYIDIKIHTVTGSGNALSGNMESQDDYYERLDYFVTYANQDISLIQNSDTLSPVLYHFERNYGLVGYNTILLAFDNDKVVGDRSLMINDQILGVGRVNFQFKEQDILATPRLKKD